MYRRLFAVRRTALRAAEGPRMTDESLTAVALSRAIAGDDFASLSGLLLETLARAANDGRSIAPASFGAEFTTSGFPAQKVDVTAHVERATRTLIFVAAEAKSASGARLAVASGVFKVSG